MAVMMAAAALELVGHLWRAMVAVQAAIYGGESVAML